MYCFRSSNLVCCKWQLSQRLFLVAALLFWAGKGVEGAARHGGLFEGLDLSDEDIDILKQKISESRQMLDWLDVDSFDETAAEVSARRGGGGLTSEIDNSMDDNVNVLQELKSSPTKSRQEQKKDIQDVPLSGSSKSRRLAKVLARLVGKVPDDIQDMMAAEVSKAGRRGGDGIGEGTDWHTFRRAYPLLMTRREHLVVPHEETIFAEKLVDNKKQEQRPAKQQESQQQQQDEQQPPKKKVPQKQKQQQQQQKQHRPQEKSQQAQQQPKQDSAQTKSQHDKVHADVVKEVEERLQAALLFAKDNGIAMKEVMAEANRKSPKQVSVKRSDVGSEPKNTKFMRK